MKTYRQFNEDIQARNAALKQRADDQMAATKQKIRDKKASDAAASDREAMKDEIKRELKNEVYDPEIQGRSQIKKSGEGGRVGADRRKTEPEKRRMKAAGGGKMVPAKSYKDRKDIGTQKQRSTKEQQPEKPRGTAGLSLRDQQRKAAMERRARKSGAKTPTASELLSKKSAKKVSPSYTPQKASGKSAAERKATMKKGERTLRDIQLKNLGKKSEKELKNPITQKEITRRNKAK